MNGDQTIGSRLAQEWPETAPMSVDELLASKAVTDYHRDFLKKVRKNEARWHIEVFRVPGATEGEVCFAAVQFLCNNGYIIARLRQSRESTDPSMDEVSLRNPEWGQYIFAPSVDNTHACMYNISYHQETGIAVILSDVKMVNMLPGT